MNKWWLLFGVYYYLYVYVCLSVSLSLYLFIFLYISIVSAFVCVCLYVCYTFYLTEKSRSRNSTSPKTPLSSRKLKFGRIYPNPANSPLSNLRQIQIAMNNTVLLPVGLNTTHSLKRNASRREVLYETDDSYHVAPRVCKVICTGTKLILHNV